MRTRIKPCTIKISLHPALEPLWNNTGLAPFIWKGRHLSQVFNQKIPRLSPIFRQSFAESPHHSGAPPCPWLFTLGHWGAGEKNPEAYPHPKYALFAKEHKKWLLTQNTKSLGENCQVPNAVWSPQCETGSPVPPSHYWIWACHPVPPCPSSQRTCAQSSQNRVQTSMRTPVPAPTNWVQRSMRTPVPAGRASGEHLWPLSYFLGRARQDFSRAELWESRTVTLWGRGKSSLCLAETDICPTASAPSLGASCTARETPRKVENPPNQTPNPSWDEAPKFSSTPREKNCPCWREGIKPSLQNPGFFFRAAVKKGWEKKFKKNERKFKNYKRE